MGPETIHSFSSPEDRQLEQLQHLAELTNEAQDLEDVILILQSLLTVAPSSMQARHLLRSVEIEARESSLSLSPITALKIKTLTLKARDCLEKNPHEAIIIIEEALALNPYHQGANNLLAQAGLLAHMPMVAVFAYETISNKYPNDLQNLHRLAELYLRLHHPEEASSVYEQILELDPSDEAATHGIHLCHQPIPDDVEIVPLLKSTQTLPIIAQNLDEDPAIDAKQLEDLDMKLHAMQETPPESQTPEWIDEYNQITHERDTVLLRILTRDLKEDPENPRTQFDLAECYLHLGHAREAFMMLEHASAEPSLRQQSLILMTRCIVHGLIQDRYYSQTAAKDIKTLNK